MYIEFKNKIINKNRKEKYQSGGLIIDEDELSQHGSVACWQEPAQ
jgi:hypothetical protein